MIKAIIFDADGVVINGEMFSLQLARDFGISTATTLPFFNGIFQKCLIGRADLKVEIKPYLKEWGWQKSVDELLDYWFKAEHNIDERLVRDIYTFRSKGIKCYLATNQEKYRIAYMKDQMGFRKLFDGIFSSAEIGCKKPGPEFFQKILNKLPDFYSNEILCIDNSQNAISAAQNLGLSTHLYQEYQELKKYFLILGLPPAE